MIYACAFDTSAHHRSSPGEFMHQGEIHIFRISLFLPREIRVCVLCVNCAAGCRPPIRD